MSVLPKAGVVLASDTANNLYAVALSRVLAVADGTLEEPIDVSSDAAVSEHSGDHFAGFKTLGESHLLVSAGSFGDPLEAHPLQLDGATLVIGPPQRLMENEQAFEGVVPLTGDLVYLPHFERALIARLVAP